MEGKLIKFSSKEEKMLALGDVEFVSDWRL